MERFRNSERRAKDEYTSPESARDLPDAHVVPSDIAQRDIYLERVEETLHRQEYDHWSSPEEQALNRKRIEEYDSKKRTVDKACLQTQSSVLREHGYYIDQESLRRMADDFGSNKVELYNEPYFVSDMARGPGSYRVLGLREFPSGKVCIRDSSDMERLKHTATHETMHDLSYQRADREILCREVDAAGNAMTEAEVHLHSGIHEVVRRERMTDGRTETIYTEQKNVYLNEGITELYTIEERQKRGEAPAFDSYSQEVSWAIGLREKVGADAVAAAYFGGDLVGLRDKVDNMSDYPNAFSDLSHHIDLYHRTGQLKHRERVNDILDSLAGGKILVKRRAIVG